MPSTRMRFSCGHKGFGAFCHRCADSERFAKLADGSLKPTAAKLRKRHNFQPAFSGWKSEHFLAESARLKTNTYRSHSLLDSVSESTTE